MNETSIELKHCTGSTADIALVEYPAWPHYQVGAWRLDCIFLLAGTYHKDTAEAIYLPASVGFWPRTAQDFAVRSPTTHRRRPSDGLASLSRSILPGESLPDPMWKTVLDTARYWRNMTLCCVNPRSRKTMLKERKRAVKGAVW